MRHSSPWRRRPWHCLCSHESPWRPDMTREKGGLPWHNSDKDCVSTCKPYRKQDFALVTQQNIAGKSAAMFPRQQWQTAGSLPSPTIHYFSVHRLLIQWLTPFPNFQLNLSLWFSVLHWRISGYCRLVHSMSVRAPAVLGYLCSPHTVERRYSTSRPRRCHVLVTPSHHSDPVNS
jgi:hypothetical protein